MINSTKYRGYEEYKFKLYNGYIGILKIGWSEKWGCDVSYIFEDGHIEYQTWENREDIILLTGDFIRLK